MESIDAVHHLPSKVSKKTVDCRVIYLDNVSQPKIDAIDKNPKSENLVENTVEDTVEDTDELSLSIQIKEKELELLKLKLRLKKGS